MWPKTFLPICKRPTIIIIINLFFEKIKYNWRPTIIIIIIINLFLKKKKNLAEGKVNSSLLEKAIRL